MSGLKPRPVENVNLPLTGTEYHYKRIAGGAPITVANGTPVISRDTSYRAGFDIPGYHRMFRKGDLIPFTPWEKFVARTSWTGNMQYTHTATSTVWRTDSNWSHPTSLVPGWDAVIADARNATSGYDTQRYVQQSAAAIYSSGFDALTFLSEFHKTAAMFSSAVARLANMKELFLRFYRSNLNKQNWTILETLERFWLEYRYGWRLLYYDMVDIQAALAKLGRERVRFKQRAGTNVNSSKTVNYTYNGTIIFTVTAVDEVVTRLRGTCFADIDPPEFQFNPLTTSWELIRFSFIIDWFIGIGQWLETISFLACQSNYVAAGGIHYTLKRTWSVTSKSAITGYVFDVANSSGELNYNYILRTPQSVPNFPLINVRLNVPKVLDLTAIVFSFFAGSETGKQLKNVRV